jgi:hypothetical protein
MVWEDITVLYIGILLFHEILASFEILRFYQIMQLLFSTLF